MQLELAGASTLLVFLVFLSLHFLIFLLLLAGFSGLLLWLLLLLLVLLDRTCIPFEVRMLDSRSLVNSLAPLL